jgi:hypothetical protein
MEFRLTYDGLLPSAGNKNNRKQEKHDIRMGLHPQLLELWFTKRIGQILNLRSSN